MSIRTDFNQILHIESLVRRSDICETASKLVQGFGRGEVRNFAYPIDFTAYIRVIIN